MPEKNGHSDRPSPTDLDDFEKKLAAAQARRSDKSDEKARDDNSLLGMAWRLSTELLASVLVGMFLGWGIDTVVGMSVFRTAAAMDAKSAHIPKGNDMPDRDDDV
jgi:ATP synthase protein I